MNLDDRIDSFVALGDQLRDYQGSGFQEQISPLKLAASASFTRNPWFTPDHITMALNNLGGLLSRESLNLWLVPYRQNPEQAIPVKTVAVVMAGNIPAVGFHDLLCVLMSGHRLLAKLSSSDDQLIPAIVDILTGLQPEWKQYITFTTGKLENFDAIIATGSTNTSRYFEYYFGRYPHIIRKNRNAIAILDGHESLKDLEGLADDIFLYFGMGCRNVSRLFLPAGFDFEPLTRAFAKYDHFFHHHKYRNNYDYNRAVFLLNQIPHVDTGTILLKEDTAIASRIAVLHYGYYHSREEMANFILMHHEEIQCVVTNMDFPFKTTPPGKSQMPFAWDYPDGVDTMEFLRSKIR